MKKFPTVPLYPRILLALAICGTTLPITGAYFVSLQMLCWLVASRRWWPGAPAHRADDVVPPDSLTRLRRALRPLHLGVAAFVAGTVLASLVAWVQSPFTATLPLSKVLKV